MAVSGEDDAGPDVEGAAAVDVETLVEEPVAVVVVLRRVLVEVELLVRRVVVLRVLDVDEVERVDVEVELAQWSSFSPPSCPWCSQSFPWPGWGSGRHGFPVRPWEQGSWPGGAGGFEASAYPDAPIRTAPTQVSRTRTALLVRGVTRGTRVPDAKRR